MSTVIEEVSLALLAGGTVKKGSPDGGPVTLCRSALAEWMLATYGALFAHTYIVTKDPDKLAHLGVPVIWDAVPEEGWSTALYVAVLAAPTERVLCLACTMPHVSGDFLRRLVAASKGNEIAVPTRRGISHPCCAVYARSALPALRALLPGGEQTISDLWAETKTQYLDVDSGEFGDPEKLFATVSDPHELPAVGEFRAPTREAPIGPAEPLSMRFAHLAPRIRAFMEVAPVPVVSFVGKKKTGKTTVLVRVVQEMVARGHRIAVIKHDLHGFDADVPGRDTYRLRQAGATVTGISSPDKQMWIILTRREPELPELISKVDEPVDLIITEGFKRQDAPKVEVARRERSEQLICHEDELLGIVSDMSFDSYHAPQLDLNDTVGICDLLEATLLHVSAPVGSRGPVSS